MFFAVACSAKVVLVLAEPPNEATAEIQTDIDNAKTMGEIVVLPAGDTDINVGLTLPQKSGLVIEGVGASELLTYANALSGASTRLIASGEDRVDLNLLTVPGAEVAIRDLSLFGMTKTQLDADAARAACGLLITKTGEGLATGGVTLDNAYVAGFETGIQAAVGVTENNCERCDFRKVRFHFNDAGFTCKSQQSMGFGLTGCEWYDNLDCIRVEGGGKIIVDNAFVHHPDDDLEHTFLKFAPRDAVDSIGPNNAFYHIKGLYVDQLAPNLKLVSMRPVDDENARVEYCTTTIFEGVHISYETYDEPAVEVAGRSSTTFRDGYGAQADWVKWDNNPSGPYAYVSRVVFDNFCLFDCDSGDDLLNEEASRGSCRVIVINCYDQFGTPIPDYDELVVGDLP